MVWSLREFVEIALLADHDVDALNAQTGQ